MVPGAAHTEPVDSPARAFHVEEVTSGVVHSPRFAAFGYGQRPSNGIQRVFLCG